MSYQTEDESQDNHYIFNNSFEKSIRFPLDSCMKIMFTGFFNGFNVEVKSPDEVALLYHMGCFGKGSVSRSKPRMSHTDGTLILRKRQYLKRNFWYKKFGDTRRLSDSFLKEIDKLTFKILSDRKKMTNKEIIDLVSSDEDETVSNMNENETLFTQEKCDNVVIVPNSDSEEDNYFAKMKPKCCLNKVRINEKLVLTLQEAFFLRYGLGCLHIIDNNKSLDVDQCWKLFNACDKNFLHKYIVYHYFRSKGYIVKPGSKFGGDYLLYKEGPGINHASYIVVIKSILNGHSSWISILGHVRMAVTTAKDVLIAEVITPNKVPKLPEGLQHYSVRELVLNRNFPITINETD